MHKIVTISELPLVSCNIEIENGNLSISGRTGHSSGQIITDFKEYDSRGHMSIEDLTLALGWTKEKIKQFFDIWDRWHLNNMRAGCEHQREAGWNKQKIDESLPLETYGKFFEGQGIKSWNMWAWIPEKDHPQGLLSKACPVCGYRYGSAWLKEELPQNVIDFLEVL